MAEDRVLPNLSEKLEQHIIDTCLRLSEFDNQASLRAAFVTGRLREVRDQLPEANTKESRVKETLKLLGEQGLLRDFFAFVAARYSPATWDGSTLRQLVYLVG